MPGIMHGPSDRINAAGGEAAIGATGGATITAPQPASVATATGTAAPDTTITGATGGATTIITTGTGGTGSDYSYTTGAGGVAASAATASTGGRGGNYTIALGAGGAANNAANIGTNLGGKGGSYSLTAGNGGAAANGTDTGGAGGDVALVAGNGGNGDTGGVGGNVTITAGNAGTGGNVNGGNITLTAGRDTGSGTEGALTVVTGGSTRLTVTGVGLTWIGSTGRASDSTLANANMTTGITISQGTADNQVLAFKSSDVAHGITGVVETDTFASFTKSSASEGGLKLTGYIGGSGATGLNLTSYAVADDTLKTTSARGYVFINAIKKSGTGGGEPGADAGLLVIAANAVSRFVFDAEGTLHSIGASNTDTFGGGSGCVVTAGGASIATAATAGGATTLTITPGAHTAVTAESIAHSHAAQTITITGGYATQRFVSFGQPTISAASGLTVTTASTVNIAGAPTVASSAVVTNTYALRVGGNTTIAGAAATTYGAIDVPAHTVTTNTTTQITSSPAVAGIRIGQITVAQSGGAVTVDNAASLYIAAAPAAGGSVTLTSPYAVWVDAGHTRLDGTLSVGGDTNGASMLYIAGTLAPAAGTVYGLSVAAILKPNAGNGTVYGMFFAAVADSTNTPIDNTYDLYLANPTNTGGGALTTVYGLSVASITSGGTNNYGIKIAAPSGGSGDNIGLWNAGTTKLDAALTLTPTAIAGGAVALTITPGAHTAMTAEVLDVSLAAHSVTLTDGTTIALARSVVFGATTYVGAAAGGTETVTTAITAEFGLPVQGANLTLTNAPISARFLGNVILGNILPPAAGPTNTLAIASGTAPTAVVADSCAFFSADAGGVAGYAAPHYIAETNALALVVVGAHVKADTGDTANPFEGLIQINKTDNVAKLYADGGWRTIASGW